MVVHLIFLLTQTLTLIFLSLPSLINSSQFDYNTLVFKQCDSESSQNLFLHAQVLSSFLHRLESEASRSKFFKTLVGNEEQAVSGWFQCREDYSTEICGRCVSDLREISSRFCGNALSARVHLQGCHLVYEFEHVETLGAQGNNHHTYKLLETPQHGLIHKICDGATAEIFPGFEEMRTEAITAAETGVIDGHGFYENTYNLLHIVAQCDGHIEPCSCGECVAAAAATASEECRWSIAGKIYLEGCYVGYTYHSHEFPDDSYHGSKVNTGKSLAIVVGGVTALVFVAIFFMFLKSLRRKGDDC